MANVLALIFCYSSAKGLPSSINPTIRISTTRSYLKLFAPLRLSNNQENIPDSINRLVTEKDWFADGREVARQLKMDLGIVSTEEDFSDGTSSPNKMQMNNWNGGAVKNNSFTVSSMESGRAAARNLLQHMMKGSIDEPKHFQQSQSDIDANNLMQQHQFDQLSSTGSTNYFDSPSRKSHCITICLVPPTSATKVWEQFTSVRRECKDAGFYRWPPHANLLYPFIEPLYSSEDDTERSMNDVKIQFRNEIASYLSKASVQIEPFDVTIDSFGTFGNDDRGVLWAYPKSFRTQSSDKHNDEEPLIRLQRVLEGQFPMCNDTRKTGAFRPHMTISHYVSNNDALIAKKRVESGWRTVSFHVPEIYILERKGDNGQFKILATIGLGMNNSKVEFHDPPLCIAAMPTVEERWVYDARMDMKTRRKNNMKRGRRRKERLDLQASYENECVDNESL